MADDKDCGCSVESHGWAVRVVHKCKYPTALETIERLKAELAEIDRVYGIKNAVTVEITGITLKDI